jgi:mannose-6-phosphate isomerase-like protein (cupin superfamily)
MGQKLHLPDVPETATSAGRWQPLNSLLGVSNFGVNAVAIEPGEDIDIEHDEVEAQHQEVYVVVAGRAAFRLGSEEFEAGPGDIIAVPDPAETRNYRALEPGTRIVCFGAGPGAEHPYGEWINDPE